MTPPLTGQNLSIAEAELQSAASFDSAAGVYNGEPWEAWAEHDIILHVLTAKKLPYVYQASLELRGIQDDHDLRSIEPITVLHAHGWRSPQDDRWLLPDGRHIPQVVQTYNLNNPIDPIRFVVACNPGGLEQEMLSVGHGVNSNLHARGVRLPYEDVPTLSVGLENRETGRFHIPKELGRLMVPMDAITLQ